MKCRYRLVIGLTIYLTTAVNYWFRVHLSISLLAMDTVKYQEDIAKAESDMKKLHGKYPDLKDKSAKDFSIEELKNKYNVSKPRDPENYGPRYDWTPRQEGLILQAYFIGYTLGSLPAGIMSELLGPWNCIFYTMALTAIFSCLCVTVTSENIVGLFICRFLMGFCGALHFPCLHGLISTWAPPTEKGMFVACLLGGVLGSVVSSISTGVIIETCAWMWSFYFPAIVALCYLIIWAILVTSTPEESWFCPQEEKDYIINTRVGIMKGNVVPPYFKMMTSIKFISLIVGQFGSLWGLFQVIVGAPKFLNNALGFDIRKAGMISALPYLLKLIMSFVFGAAGDALLRRGVKKVYIRKGFVFFSHFLPGLLLYCIYFASSSTYGVVALIIISVGLTGAVVHTTIQNAQDLAPNFAATLFGIANFFASTTGFICAAMNAEITKEKSTLHEWTIIYSIGGTVYIVCGTVFVIFGSAEIQPWNEKVFKENPLEPPKPGT